MESSIKLSNVHIDSHFTFNEADNAIIEMKNSEYFGWKFDENRHIAIVTDNPVTPDTVTL